ncbi:hypothetical protein Tco_0290307, partial [Tanacetum coccineum]
MITKHQEKIESLGNCSNFSNSATATTSIVSLIFVASPQECYLVTTYTLDVLLVRIVNLKWTTELQNNGESVLTERALAMVISVRNPSVMVVSDGFVTEK